MIKIFEVIKKRAALRHFSLKCYIALMMRKIIEEQQKEMFFGKGIFFSLR
jgi:hypothetical protein